MTAVVSELSNTVAELQWIRAGLAEEAGAIAKVRQETDELASAYRGMFDTGNSAHVGGLITSAVAKLDSAAGCVDGTLAALGEQLAYMIGQSSAPPRMHETTATVKPPTPVEHAPQDLLGGAANDALLRDDAARNRLFRSIGFETSYMEKDGLGLLHLTLLPSSGFHPQGFDPNIDDFFVRSLDRHGRVVGQSFAFGPPRHRFDYPAEGLRRAASIVNLTTAQLLRRVRGAMAGAAGRHAAGTAQILAAGWVGTHHGPIAFVVAAVAGQIVAFIVRKGSDVVSRWLLGHGDPLSMGLQAFCPAPPEDGSIAVIRLPTRREAVASALDALAAERRRSGDNPSLRSAEAELEGLRATAERWGRPVGRADWWAVLSGTGNARETTARDEIRRIQTDGPEAWLSRFTHRALP